MTPPPAPATEPARVTSRDEAVPAVAQPEPNPVQPKKWYEGGTLSGKTMGDWARATPEDRLASCADLLASLWIAKKLTPRIQDSVSTVDELKPFAEQLRIALDTAVDKSKTPDAKKLMFAQPISETAVLVLTMMAYV